MGGSKLVYCLVLMVRLLGLIRQSSCLDGTCARNIETFCGGIARRSFTQETDGCDSVNMVQSSMVTCAEHMIERQCNNDTQEREEAEDVVAAIPDTIASLYQELCVTVTTPAPDRCEVEKSSAELCLLTTATVTPPTAQTTPTSAGTDSQEDATTQAPAQTDAAAEATTQADEVDETTAAINSTSISNGTSRKRRAPQGNVVVNSSAEIIHNSGVVSSTLTGFGDDIFASHQDFCNFVSSHHLGVTSAVNCVYNYMTTCANVSAAELVGVSSGFGHFSNILSEWADDDLAFVMMGLCGVENAECQHEVSHLDECATDLIENVLVDLGDYSALHNVSVHSLLGGAGGHDEGSGDVYNMVTSLGDLDMELVANVTDCSTMLDFSYCVANHSNDCFVHDWISNLMGNLYPELWQNIERCEIESQRPTPSSGDSAMQPKGTPLWIRITRMTAILLFLKNVSMMFR